MAKCVPIFTQLNHNVIIGVQSKFDEIQCVCKIKQEMANELKSVWKQYNKLTSGYCILSRIELQYLFKVMKCRRKLVVKRQKNTYDGIIELKF